VTADLFKRFPTPQDLATTERVNIEMAVRPLGFARQKAKSLQLASRFLVDEFNGTVPEKMQDLMRLPGVSRKIANFVLGEGFDSAQGLGVDNQVKRVVRRLGLADGRSVEAVEQKLLRIVPAEHWFEFSLLASRHGEVVCLVRQPRCAGCQLNAICPSAKL
jgi:endonuclease-3